MGPHMLQQLSRDRTSGMRLRWFMAIVSIALSSQFCFAAQQEPTAFIFLMRTGAQTMGKTNRTENIYLGSDGTIQKTIEDEGTSDSISNMQQGRADAMKAANFFNRLAPPAPASARESGASNTGMDDYLPAGVYAEIFYRRRFFSTADSAYFDNVQTEVGEFTKGVGMRKFPRGCYLRSMRITSPEDADQFKLDGILHALSEKDLVEYPLLKAALVHERRLFEISFKQELPPFMRRSCPSGAQVENGGVAYSLRMVLY